MILRNETAATESNGIFDVDLIDEAILAADIHRAKA
jgi:hypothetical protein